MLSFNRCRLVVLLCWSNLYLVLQPINATFKVVKQYYIMLFHQKLINFYSNLVKIVGKVYKNNKVHIKIDINTVSICNRIIL